MLRGASAARVSQGCSRTEWCSAALDRPAAGAAANRCRSARQNNPICSSGSFRAPEAYKRAATCPAVWSIALPRRMKLRTNSAIPNSRHWVVLASAGSAMLEKATELGFCSED